jgi:hypothetical protein
MSNRRRYILIVLLALASVSATLMVTLLFRVKEVECSLSSGSRCPDELTQSSATLKNRSLFFSDFQTLIEQPGFNDHHYKLANLSKRLPSTLIIELQPLETAYLIALRGSDRLVAVSESGVIHTDPVESDSAVVEVEKNTWEQIIEKDSAEELHSTIMRLLDSLYKNEFFYDTITWINHDEIRVKIAGGVEVIFDSSLSELTVYQTKSLLNSKEFAELEVKPVEVDMRFRLPVLRTSR